MPIRKSDRRRVRGASLLLLAPLALAACGQLRPDPITASEHAERARVDLDKLQKEYQPLTGPLTLAEAIARALKYNYDAELTRIEQSLQERQIDLAMAQMLPRLAANAGYSARSDYNAAESIAVKDHTRSLDYSYSEDKEHASASLQFSWNALDVGVGFFQARQQGYRALVAVERRRKVIDNIVKGVQEAYWKAAVAQQLLPKLEPLLGQAQTMLDNSREAARRRLQPRTQALEYQQGMLEVIAQLRHMRMDLTNSQVRLATLINVPISVAIRVADKPASSLVAPPSIDTAQLELISLNLRPELRESAYQEKIDRQDIYKEIIKMMPGIGILGSLNYDSNSLLYRNTWGDVGIRATYNLVSLIEGPQAIRAARTAVEVAQARRMALAVAVLTQVNLGAQEYLSALEDLSSATEIAHLQRELASTASGAADAEAQTEANRVRRALGSMAADFEYGQALASAYSALASLYIASGVDIVSPDADVSDLGKLVEHVSRSIQPWQRGALPTMPATATASEETPQRVAAVEPVRVK